jgi:hypothetical protein
MALITKTINTKNKTRNTGLVAGLTLTVATGIVALNTNWLETDSDEMASLHSSLKQKGHNLNGQNIVSHSVPEETNMLARPQGLEDAPKDMSQKSVYFSVISAEEYENSTSLGPLPRAIQGIALPTLSYDQYGNLIATENLMQLIEHFLSVA